MPKISTIIITYNEEDNIRRCLESVSPIADEIIVVDSKSTDRTLAIAREYTDRVYIRDWPGYGAQKQWALEQCSHEWVLSLDADEEVSPKLRSEIEGLDFTADGYYTPRLTWYMNRWIRHSGWYPNHVLRLFRKEKAVFTPNIVHETATVDGPTRRLNHPLFHYSYRDISHHIEKMNDFTSLAARQMYELGKRPTLHSLTLYPLFGFLKMYVQKRGFLDGSAGLVIAVLHFYYVFLKYAKLLELHIQHYGRRSSRQDSSHSIERETTRSR